MRVEKCPRCNVMPLLYTVTSVENDRTSVWKRVCPRCERGASAITYNGACRKWNRWARREAKRIAKECK